MTFDTMKKGYNRYQVDDAINELNAEISLLKKQIDAYELQSNEDKKTIIALNDKLSLLTHNIEVKEKAANEMAQIALKEANEIIYVANNNADAIVKEALLSAKDILLNMSKLGIEAKEIKNNMNNQLEQLTNAINQFDIPPIPNQKLLDKCSE